MHVRLRFRSALVLFLVLACVASPAAAQSGFDDDRVMLQGFYWESHRHGHPGYEVFGQRGWYTIVRDNAETIADGRFDLIWLPPPSDAGEVSAGYAPKEYFNLGNSYGSFDRSSRDARGTARQGDRADCRSRHEPSRRIWRLGHFQQSGVGAGRSRATTRPSTIRRPAWQARPSINAEPTRKRRRRTVRLGGTTYPYDAYRDVDHTNGGVRRDLFRYLLQLKSLGYRGWRYDMVHGFHARWIAEYNRRTRADLLRRRVPAGQAGRAARLGVAHGHDTRRSANLQFSVFDFTTQFTLKDNKDRYRRLVRLRPRARSDGRHDRRPAVEAARGDVSRKPRHRLPHQPGRHSGEGPQVRQLRRTPGRWSRRTPTSSRIPACRASTGSTTSTGARTCRTRSARWSTRGRWLAFTRAANSPCKTTRGHAASTLRE